MTRKSKRELERAIDDLTGDVTANVDAALEVLYRDGRTGGLVDADGVPTEPDPGVEQTVVIDRFLAMPRERAKAEGREILGPVEAAPAGSDVVRVARGKR